MSAGKTVFFSEVRLLTLAAPTLSLLFAAAFLGIWSRWRRFRYLLWLVAAFVGFSCGMLSQILEVPHDLGRNSMLSCALYTMAVFALNNACLKRVDAKANVFVHGAVSILVIASIFYFFYIDKNLNARIYILNFGYGALFVATAIQFGSAAKKIADRFLFWVLLVFGLHFFPRTILSLGNVASSRDVVAFAHTSYWIWLNLSLVIFAVLLGVTLLATIVSDVVEELKRQAITDPLTGLLNRRGFEEFARRQMAKAEAQPLTLILCDIDQFKIINDLHGHAEGDVVIEAIAELLRENLRSADTAAAGRFGGEEFVLLLPNVPLKDAYALAERLRRAIEETRFGAGGLRQQCVTASFGVVACEGGETLEAALRRVDELLYAAKRSGRNRAFVDRLHTDWFPIEGSREQDPGPVRSVSEN